MTNPTGTTDTPDTPDTPDLPHDSKEEPGHRRLTAAEVRAAVPDLELHVTTRHRLGGTTERPVGVQMALDPESAAGWELFGTFGEDVDLVAAGVSLPAWTAGRETAGSELGDGVVTVARVELTVVDLWAEDTEEVLESSSDLAHANTALSAAEREWDGRYLVFADTVVVAPAWPGHRLGHLALVESVAAACTDPTFAVALVVGSLDEHGRNNRTLAGPADPGAAKVGRSWSEPGFAPVGGDRVAWFADHEELLDATRDRLRDELGLDPAYP